jgi:hypothetical protein
LTVQHLRATVAIMESKLAEYAEQQLIEAAKRMTSEQRLRAYLEHSKRMSSLQRAGKAMRIADAARSEATLANSAALRSVRHDR